MLDPVVNKTSVRFFFPAEDIVKKHWPSHCFSDTAHQKGWVVRCGAGRRGGGAKAELLLITEPDEPVNHSSPRQQLSPSSLKIAPLEAARACWPIKPQCRILDDHVWVVSMCGKNMAQMLQSILQYFVLKSTGTLQVKVTYWRGKFLWEHS